MPGKFYDLYERVPIRALEGRAGILQVLLYLNKKGEVNFQKIVEEARITWRSLYGSLDKLNKLGMIRQRTENSSYPPKNMISPTDKRRKAAEKLNEIEKIIGGYNLKADAEATPYGALISIGDGTYQGRTFEGDSLYVAIPKKERDSVPAQIKVIVE